MSSFQNIKLRNIGNLLDYIPEHELRIVEALREIILDTIPGCREKLSYNVPYYYRNSRICFIWPGSIPWGTTREGVIMGFCRGFELIDEEGYLEINNRKEVRTKTFYDVAEIDAPILRRFISDAADLDKAIKKKPGV